MFQLNIDTLMNSFVNLDTIKLRTQITYLDGNLGKLSNTVNSNSLSNTGFKFTSLKGLVFDSEFYLPFVSTS